MAKKIIVEDTHCRYCIHARDFHEKNSRGEFFLCKCEFSNRSMFLDRDTCPKFVKKNG